MPEQDEVIADLVADADVLDHILGDLEGSDWRRETPAPGWTIAHQVAHLSATFRLAALAASDPERFQAMKARLSDDFDANVAGAMQPYLGSSPEQMFRRWQDERHNVVQALRALPADEMVPWLVRPLPASILAAAGIMELFAHGQDIVDALGATRTPTDRIRHLVAFVVRTWDIGYLARGETPPEVAFRFEITAPSGVRWVYGPDDATQRITGSAIDLCLLATRRRHRADLSLTATGDQADHWLNIAQAYRGSPGEGRRPGQFDRGPMSD
jgi:enediyne biosynthesis protein E11